METYHLSDSEYRFMQVVWDTEPVGSGELVALCREKLGWKKSTTYTVLKKLGERGVVQNEESVVTGFELGADDYIAKPFRPLELISRPRRHLWIKHSTAHCPVSSRPL